MSGCGARCQVVVMATWSDNIQAHVRAVSAKMLAHDRISEEKLAADMDMWWHLVEAELECGAIDESSEFVGGEIDWERTMAGYRDWMRRHPVNQCEIGKRRWGYRGASCGCGLGCRVGELRATAVLNTAVLNAPRAYRPRMVPVTGDRSSDTVRRDGLRGGDGALAGAGGTGGRPAGDTYGG